MSLSYALPSYFHALKTLHVLLVRGGVVPTFEDFCCCISLLSSGLSSRINMFRFFILVCIYVVCLIRAEIRELGSRIK